MAERKAIAPADLALLDPDGVFAGRLAGDRAALIAWLDAMQTDGAREEQLKHIATLAHRLAGAAGTFGHVEVGDVALKLEALILDREAGRGVSVRRDAVRLAAAALILALDESLASSNGGVCL
ncbi:MAG TPA: Hpt domain-containing protein [Mesorhizobium sp.]